MAKKLYEEASVLAIANAIRAKNGSTATYKVAQMADAVLAIAPLQPDVEEYPQMSTTVAAYLTAAEAAYTDANGGSVSALDSYTGASGIKDAPLGKALTMQGGTRYQQDETTGIGGKLNNILGGESVIYNAVPGHVLRYIVKGSGGDVIDSGRVKPTGTVRMMKFIGYVKNCRDLGGWACDGGTVRYGRMYRCAAPGAAESADANIAQNANIRYHFDLRDNASLESSPFGSEVYYKRYPLSAYYSDLVDLTKSHYAEMAALLRAVFDVVIHGNGVIYHCSLGRDRTGTLSFILLALLGVSRKHVDMDYELSGFSSLSDAGTPQKRTSANYTGLANYFASFGKSSLRDNVVKWALKAGLTIDELNAYRSAAINGTPAALNASDYVTQYTLTQHLTDCTSNAAGTEISEGAALSVTITPNAGKKLGSILKPCKSCLVHKTIQRGNKLYIRIHIDSAIPDQSIKAYIVCNKCPLLCCICLLDIERQGGKIDLRFIPFRNLIIRAKLFPTGNAALRILRQGSLTKPTIMDDFRNLMRHFHTTPSFVLPSYSRASIMGGLWQITTLCKRSLDAWHCIVRSACEYKLSHIAGVCRPETGSGILLQANPAGDFSAFDLQVVYTNRLAPKCCHTNRRHFCASPAAW